jgi:flagellar motor switch protein FliM
MSGRAANNLGNEKIHQLLAAVGSRPTEDTTQIEAQEYNWNEPHYFSSEELVKLNYFAEKVATAVAGKFADFCRSEFDVTIASATQHFADEFLNHPSDGEQKDYYLAFGTDQEHLCGLVGIPEKTAVVWATQLLGDSGSEESDSSRDLSQLEESLLFDLASALVEVFSRLYKTSDFQPAGSIVKGQWPLELPDTEEVFKITFNVKKAVPDSKEQGLGAYFLIPCSKLELIAGKSSQAAGESSAGDTSRAVLSHLQEMPVIVKAQLASTVLTFEEVMNLQADDILLLDKRVEQPVELVVDNRRVCYGWPAKSAGKYAVAITATAFGDTA